MYRYRNYLYRYINHFAVVSLSSSCIYLSCSICPGQQQPILLLLQWDWRNCSPVPAPANMWLHADWCSPGRHQHTAGTWWNQSLSEGNWASMPTCMDSRPHWQPCRPDGLVLGSWYNNTEHHLLWLGWWWTRQSSWWKVWRFCWKCHRLKKRSKSLCLHWHSWEYVLFFSVPEQKRVFLVWTWSGIIHITHSG